MIRFPDYARDGLELLKEDRDWSEYDEYREHSPSTQEAERLRIGTDWLIVTLVRDDSVLWQSRMSPADRDAAPSPQEREEWCVASFRASVAKAGVLEVNGLLLGCTDRATRKELKRQRRRLRKNWRANEHHVERMDWRQARAEDAARKTQKNEQAASWLRATSR